MIKFTKEKLFRGLRKKDFALALLVATGYFLDQNFPLRTFGPDVIPLAPPTPAPLENSQEILIPKTTPTPTPFPTPILDSLGG